MLDQLRVNVMADIEWKICILYWQKNCIFQARDKKAVKKQEREKVFFIPPDYEAKANASFLSFSLSCSLFDTLVA